jgi:hypothetical protein
MGIELDNKNNLGEMDTEKSIVFIRNSEKVMLEEQGSTSSTESIGNSTILGSSTNGLFGTNTGTANGLQQLLGEHGRVEVEQKRTAPNRTFRTRFSTTDYKSTGWAGIPAAWVGDGVVTFEDGYYARSETLFNCGTVKTATIYVDDPINLTFELTANGGTNWETVTHNTLHTFTNQGTDLRFRITATGNAEISFLRITYG